jgi:hypothetical protein
VHFDPVDGGASGVATMKRIFSEAALALMFAILPRPALSQAIAESAVIHGGSALSGKVASAFGQSANRVAGRVSDGMTTIPTRRSANMRGTRRAYSRRSGYRKQALPGKTPIAISSVQGAGMECAGAPTVSSAQTKASTSKTARCGSVPASQPQDKSTVTVSFQ